jgi:hypothetical protein
MTKPPPRAAGVNLAGADETARLIQNMAASRVPRREIG